MDTERSEKSDQKRKNMDFSELIKPGMTNEETFEVTEEYLASHIGSGAARVLATPG